MLRNKSLLIAVLFISLLAGYVLSLIVKNEQNVKNNNLTVSIAEQPVFGLVFIAEKNGYFKDEGLNVTFKRHLLGRDALDETIRGESDMATVFETPFIIRIYEGVDIKALTMLHTSSKNTALVAAKNRGINSINDLKGKTIGVVKNTSADFFIYLLLVSEGISEREVNIVNVQPSEMINNLKNGDVDAIVAWNPYLYNIQETIPPQDLTVFYSDIYTETSVLAVRGDLIDQNSELYKKFLTALIKANDFYDGNPEASRQIVSEYLPDMSDEELQKVWGDINLTLRLNNTLYTLLQREIKWLQLKQPNNVPVRPIASYVFPDILRGLRPLIVTVR